MTVVERYEILKKLGYDPDPDGAVEKRIKIGWALVGIFFTLGIFKFIMDSLGLPFLPQLSSLEDYGILIAFSMSLINILLWMWFPLEDLNVLRRWVRTGGKIFPCYTAEFFAILLAMILLLILIVSVFIGAIYFSLAGFLVYSWNLLGFAYIRKEVKKTVADAKEVYNKLDSPEKELFYSALEIVENYWCIRPDQPPIRNRQQVRHLSMMGGFFLTAVVALFELIWQEPFLVFLAYFLGTLTMIGGEIWIALWRTSRDRSLHNILEELRRTEIAQNVT
jgi:hypothetical protein